ncbi:MAG: TlpA disulfide reductase family protein [Anaerolineae bacterium]
MILNFWATWCMPCAAEMPPCSRSPMLTPTVSCCCAGINLREDATTVAPFVAEHGLRFPILISPDDATLLNYQVVGLPQTLLISPNGEIVYRQFGPVSSRWFSRELDAQICARTNAIYP